MFDESTFGSICRTPEALTAAQPQLPAARAEGGGLRPRHSGHWPLVRDPPDLWSLTIAPAVDLRRGMRQVHIKLAGGPMWNFALLPEAVPCLPSAFASDDRTVSGVCWIGFGG